MVVVLIIAFVVSWNDYIWPLIVLTSDEKFTVSLGLPLNDKPEDETEIFQFSFGSGI